MSAKSGVYIRVQFTRAKIHTCSRAPFRSLRPMPISALLLIGAFLFDSSVSAMAPSSSRRKVTTRVSVDEILATMEELQTADLLPELLVFDLDNTIWTPELYELYKKPKANTDIRLFPGVRTIMEILHEFPNNPMLNAIASRATEDDWANDLLDEFRINDIPLRDLFPDPRLIHVVCRSKRWHFEQIQKASSIDYSEMIFYDDAMFNVHDVSPLGVFCCHTPRGLTLDLFHSSLRDFAKIKQQRKEEEL